MTGAITAIANAAAALASVLLLLAAVLAWRRRRGRSADARQEAAGGVQPLKAPPVQPPGPETAASRRPSAPKTECQICGDPLQSNLVQCPDCETLHHRDCWEYHGGCSTYACPATDWAPAAGSPAAGAGRPAPAPRPRQGTPRRAIGVVVGCLVFAIGFASLLVYPQLPHVRARRAAVEAASKSPDGRALEGNGDSSRDSPAEAPQPRRPAEASSEAAARFFRAAHQGDLAAIRKLLARHPLLLRRTDPKWRETALSKAAWSGRLEVVRFLLERGAPINPRSIDGITPLHQAARRGHVEIVRYLLDHGADPRAEDDNGLTPAGWAARAGEAKIAAEIHGR